MKHTIILAAALMAGGIIANAQLTIPSDGSDGALNITEDTVIDLSQAVTGTWDQNNAANAGKGVYDPEKWAVVFKYSSVNIEKKPIPPDSNPPTGGTSSSDGYYLKFKNHPSHAPVVWLVQGNVTINGILDISGGDGSSNAYYALIPAEPGPGGFRGAARGPNAHGPGYGPAGGSGGVGGRGGAYATYYGNPQIIPLIGGSGGGTNRYDFMSGAAGGGAILIAASQQIIVNGLIDARGGEAPTWAGSWPGSGGAIRLIASEIIGTFPQNVGIPGNLLATPDGRIRIESTQLSESLVTVPETIRVPPASTPIIWPAANAPKAKVVSVDSVSPQNTDDPRAPLIASADIAIQNNNPVNIDIETRDFPIEGIVQLAVIPKFGEVRTLLPATRISGDINVATWRVTTTLPQGFVTLQARATQP